MCQSLKGSCLTGLLEIRTQSLKSIHLSTFFILLKRKMFWVHSEAVRGMCVYTLTWNVKSSWVICTSSMRCLWPKIHEQTNQLQTKSLSFRTNTHRNDSILTGADFYVDWFVTVFNYLPQYKDCLVIHRSHSIVCSLLVPRASPLW